MTTRYIAIVPDIVGQFPALPYGGSSLRLTAVHQSPHLRLFAETGGPQIISDDRSVHIVGYAFSKAFPSRRVQSLTDSESNDIRASNGASLAGSHWGAYVAFVSGANHGGIHVLRDPSGHTPCYYCRGRDFTIFTSDMDTLREFGWDEFAINFEYVSQYLYAEDLRIRATGLIGISELLGGESLHVLNGAVEILQHWSPWDHVEDIPTRTFSDWSDGLREIIDNCTLAWSTCFDHMLLAVSGGLDSSILAASLAKTNALTTTYTMATYDADGDEREYARALTEALDLPLLERFHDLRHININQSTATHLPRPISRTFGQSEIHTRLEIAASLGANAILSGRGGDNVFCYMQSATQLVDRFKSEGLTGGLAATIHDICRLTGCSIHEAIIMALKRYCNRDPSYIWRGDLQLLNGDVVIPGNMHLHHPWLCAPRGALPGKAVHISYLVRIQGTFETHALSEGRPYIAPLLSQPIVEYCLHAPTWLWCVGGANRAIARAAYADALPKKIIERKSKGGPTRFSIEVIEKNREDIWKILDNGALASNGLLDMDSIRSALISRDPIPKAFNRKISQIASTEAWIQNWINIGSAFT